MLLSDAVVLTPASLTHPTCWTSSHRSHTASSTPWHGAWTSAPTSAHLSTEWECTASQIEATQQINKSNHNKKSSIYLTTTAEVSRSGWVIDGMRSGWTTLWDSVLSSPTSAPILLEWPCQEEPEPGLTASAPVSDVSASAYTNGI